ncbi:MAG TPA: hypothetical protein VKB79_29200 [Bryobacteraceae bacterium]|nr:hypothetical protein [Bryobacteraceae bacterium]
MTFLLLCGLAIAAVIVLSRMYGRAIATVAAATCGVSVAVVMPPAFSLAVDRLADQATLAAYGLLSVFVLLRMPKRCEGARQDAAFSAAINEERHPFPETRLAKIVQGIAARRELAARNVEISVGDLALSSCPEKAERILDEVFAAALAEPGIEAVAVYGGRWPGQDRVWVAARYRELPPDGFVLANGRKDRDNPGLGAGPVTWFDNGFERVYQIPLPALTR